MYRISSNARTRFTATYEQLYPAVLSRRNASPAVIRQRIEGIISRFNTAFSSSDLVSALTL